MILVKWEIWIFILFFCVCWRRKAVGNFTLESVRKNLKQNECENYGKIITGEFDWVRRRKSNLRVQNELLRSTMVKSKLQTIHHNSNLRTFLLFYPRNDKFHQKKKSPVKSKIKWLISFKCNYRMLPVIIISDTFSHEWNDDKLIDKMWEAN